MSVAAVVGAQFGSEGKGLIVGHIARDYDAHVRVGAANAGHTLYTVEAEASEPKNDLMRKHVMQQIPCAAYANPEAELFVGPGALISPEIFMRELVQLTRYREERELPPIRLYVDPRAHVITQDQIEREGRSGLAERIGSTSTIAREGIGTAQADRVMRQAGCVPVASEKGTDLLYAAMGEMLEETYADERTIVRLSIDEEVPPMLMRRIEDKHVLLEGTQGTGLNLITGPFPFVTSRNTTATGLLADCGLPPKLDRCIIVARSYPIRVAGPSGPFHPESEEIGWEDIGVDSENERTTVTKKVRRVATFSLEQVVESAQVNGATEIALTFADYIDPRIAGRVVPDRQELEALYPKVSAWVRDVENATGLPVTYVGTGPHSVTELTPLERPIIDARRDPLAGLRG